MLQRIGQHTWKSYNSTWTGSIFAWSDVPIFKEILAGGDTGGGGIDYLAGYEKLEKEKKERVIELICTIHGHKYEKRKTIKHFKVTASDIKLLVNKIELEFNTNV